MSATWVASIGATDPTHPDFGTFLRRRADRHPLHDRARQPAARADGLRRADESDPGPYPFPPNAPIEGGPASSGDRHVLVIDRDNCVLYETGYSFPINGGASWTAFSGAVWDLKLNANRPQTWTSADAAGLPILPGLVRYDEFRRARSTTPSASRPADAQPVRLAGDAPGRATPARAPPMGARFRLKADYDISAFSRAPGGDARDEEVRASSWPTTAATGSSPGEHNPLWNDTTLNELKTMPGDNFEAVDSAPMRIATNSTKAFQPPPPVTLRQVAQGLVEPLDIQNANDGSNRLFIVQKGGRHPHPQQRRADGSNFFSLAVDQSGERGLLGLAFHPDYQPTAASSCSTRRPTERHAAVASYFARRQPGRRRQRWRRS